MRSKTKKVPLVIIITIVRFPFNARSDWLKQSTLLEDSEQADDFQLAFKFLLRKLDKSDPK